MRWILVLLLSFLSAAVWNGLLIYGGYLLGTNWGKITYWLKQYNKIVLILSVLLIIFLVLYRIIIKRKQVPSSEGKIDG